MNRTTALLLTLALLLAHTLAVYHDPEGGFAAPCDEAHVVYRVGRQAAHDGQAVFDLEGTGAEMPQALPWLWLSRWAAGSGVAPTVLSQTLSLLFGLACVTVVALFSSNRLAGLIAPLLLVVNGALATSSGDGTPTTFYTFSIAVAFFSFQRGWSLALGVFLALAISVRDECALLALLLMIFEFTRPRGPTPRLRWWWAFGPPALLLALRMYARARSGGAWFAPEFLAVFEHDEQRWRLGLHYLYDHARLFGVSALALVPLVLMLAGQLSRLGTEALLIALCGTALVAAQGGSHRPFGIALVPMLPLLCLAIQEGMLRVLDREKRWLENSIWAALVLGAAWSALPSKLPGDLALLPTRDALMNWVTPSRPVAEAWQHLLARRGLEAEIAETRVLRAIGLYLRDRVPPGTSVLSAWPGAIAYLSRQPVRDMLGRIAPAPGQPGLNPWTGAPRVDLAAALRSGADWIVLPPTPWVPVRSTSGALQLLCERFDALSAVPGRAEELRSAATDYEMVTLPVPRHENTRLLAGTPVAILRRKSAEHTPLLTIERTDRDFTIRLVHRGPPLIADLVVEWTDDEGVLRMLRPFGAFEEQGDVRARVSLLLSESGIAPVDLVRAMLPRDYARGSLRASLCSPFPAEEDGSRAEFASTVLSL